MESSMGRTKCVNLSSGLVWERNAWGNHWRLGLGWNGAPRWERIGCSVCGRSRTGCTPTPRCCMATWGARDTSSGGPSRWRPAGSAAITGSTLWRLTARTVCAVAVALAEPVGALQGIPRIGMNGDVRQPRSEQRDCLSPSRAALLNWGPQLPPKVAD